MKAIKNFDESVYVVQDENKALKIQINSVLVNCNDALFLIGDIQKAIKFISKENMKEQ